MPDMLVRVCLCFLMIGLLRGCVISTGIHVEKDWSTDVGFANPDLNTKFKVEASKSFGD